MTRQQNSDKIAIMGAGMAGSLLTSYLAQKGFQVEMFERRPDLRVKCVDHGRSINLALSTRGIHALEEVGLGDKIQDLMIPMRGRMIHDLKGKTRLIPYSGKAEEVIHSISRVELTKLLLDFAESHEGVTTYFDEECLGLDPLTGVTQVRHLETGKIREVEAQTIIGTDGAASAMRQSLLRTPRFEYSQSYLEHSYKELTIPPTEDGGFALEKHALHIWPRGGYMLIALPNLDGSFTCTLFLSYEGELSFASLDSPEKVDAFFDEQFPDAKALIPRLIEDFFGNPTGNLMTVKCFPWHFEDKLMLLGDAAHAIVPFYGQGMNCSFEDCSVFNACMEKHGNDWEAVYRECEALRKPNTDAIADLCLDNFVEMRDSVARPDFQLKRELEQKLEATFPNEFTSKYSMVTFRRTPYQRAIEQGRRQDKILAELCKGATSLDEFVLKAVKDKVAKAAP